MNKAELRQLIQETVQEALKESLTDLEPLHRGVSSSTITGKAWLNLISQLETVVDEVKDFRSQFSASRHGPLPNVDDAMLNLREIIRLLGLVKPAILGMDAIERKDMREGHPHGRYAQQAGATPFEPPQDF